MTTSRLARELKKRKPFEVLEEEVFLNLMRTAQWLGHAEEKLMKQHGLSGAGYNILRILRGAGEDGLPSLEIAGRMVTRVPDVTRLVDRLIKKNLVRRNRPDRDRRVVLVIITKKGLDLLADMDNPVIETVKRNFSQLTQQEMTDLNHLLEKARDGVPDPFDQRNKGQL